MKQTPCATGDKQILEQIGFGFLHPYKVAGMGEPWAQKVEHTLRVLKKNGIGAVLTLTEDDLYAGQYLRAGFRHLFVPVEDCDPPSPDAMNLAVGFIEGSLREGLGVAVHCFEGRGRTGTVLAGWIGLKECLGPEQAVRRIHTLRPRTVLTPSQRAFLHRYLHKPQDAGGP